MTSSQSLFCDFSVEDPSEEFQRVRDFVDCKRCLQLTECANLLASTNVTVNGSEEQNEDSAPPPNKRSRTSLSADDRKQRQPRAIADQFADIAKTKLKLSRQQSRRVYQTLRFFQLPRHKPEAIAAYRHALLHRIQIINDVSAIFSFFDKTSSWE